MIDDMDRHLGEVIAYLKQIGEYENTFVLFMSDNGADGSTALDIGVAREWVARHMDNSLENTGKANSFIEYGPGWAQVGSTPFHLYKSFMYEGGISVPAIARGPGVAGKGSISSAFTHAMDVMPTLLQLADVPHPGTEYQGRAVLPMKGRSMLPVLSGKAAAVRSDRDAVGWELGGRKALRKGDWKIAWSNKPWGTGEWELYNLASDRSEQRNLAAALPQKLAELVADYEAYERDVGVIDVPGLADRIRYSNSTRYYDDL
jgi:arylsulfatase